MKLFAATNTYKRTVAKEQGPYHEGCGLCGPNVLYQSAILLFCLGVVVGYPEYEDIDDDGGNDWQHNCQPQLYVGVHLDITITVIQSWIGSIFPQFRVQDF